MSSPGPPRHCGNVNGTNAGKSLVYEICHPLVMDGPASSSYGGYNATVVSSNCAETTLASGNGGLGTRI